METELSIFEKLSNHELECAVIGWCIIEPSAVAFAKAEANPEDFAWVLHGAIMERIYAKADAGRPITPLTLAASLKGHAGFHEKRGPNFLMDCAQGAPAFANIRDLERQVRDAGRTIVDLRIRRLAIEAMTDAQALLADRTPITDALGSILEIADLASERTDMASGSVSVTDAGWEVIKQLENPPERPPFSPTGLSQLDGIIGGIGDANLVIAGGRPGIGKSIFGTTVAIAAAAADFDVDYFSLEMVARELTCRMLCDLDYDEALREGWNTLHFSSVQHNHVNAKQLERIAMAQQRLAGLPMMIHDRDKLTIHEIASIARARAAARPNRKRRIIIDHLHLIQPTDRYRGRRVDEIAEITGACKRLAKSLGAGILLLAQLNREVDKREDKSPQLADFRDAGSIEQDADVLLGLDRPAYWLQREKSKNPDEQLSIEQRTETQANVFNIGCLKNRHGPTKNAQVYCDVASSVLRDAKPEARQVAQGFFGQPPF